MRVMPARDLERIPLPRAFGEILSLARRASCLFWGRDEGYLLILIDDEPAGKRLTLEVFLQRRRNQVDMCVLSDYDPVRKAWRSRAAKQLGTLAGNAGEEEFRAWLSRQALAATGTSAPRAFCAKPTHDFPPAAP